MTERKDNATENAFVERAKQHFDKSVANLDGETRSRLNRGRQAALAEIAPGGRTWIEWAPAAGVAAAAVVAVVMWTGNQPSDELTPTSASTDIEILFTEDSFEMLEDLEFYSWIELDDETDETLQPGGHVG
ncbi:MAG: hypothetical protein DRR11_03575 [Gammaproteobacteria bacterium]|nr:MAG: hypothetical protein DRR11_03575 [Gammaproteobacteria bacterium]RLA37781.1 MAG: hypothetical protein DRR15_00960 [Gammaproteobacteria bacterium]